ncbi:hypothetical protein [Candidatus Odyssella acanthamoebae]|uniref:Uncharacterized protein n=1 Tax=Candidatus Odyssella acanthamoebae TaxID=91604 RepID=A0A077AZ62_9PROT|nr:hypothetical protein [Candidatus Paracaedibacter acanthamoebae]AIK96020.1 hypothetical protein ID47_03590 [Candidatus Paracaedibacter acanthamoebae]
MPVLAVDNETLKKDKERLTIWQDEERMTSSEDEERGLDSKKVGSSSESSDESQEEETSESEAEGVELNTIHIFVSTSWTGEHLPLNLRSSRSRIL